MIVVRIYFFAQQNYSLVTVISYVAFSDGINISISFFVVQNVDLNTKDQKHLVDIIATVGK